MRVWLTTTDPFVSRRTRRYATALALAVAAISIGEFAHEALGTQLDFATRYAAGRTTAQGESPYDQSALDRVERQLEGVDFRYPFRDPPPVAAFFRVVSVVPFRAAQLAWAGVTVAGAIACAWLAASMLGIGVRSLSGAALLLAVATAFAPLRNGLSLEQVDPVVGAVSLAALSARRAALGGIGQAIATMKPQATLLASTAGLVRDTVRFAAGLALGWALLIGGSALLVEASWSDWVHVARSAAGGPSAAKVAFAALVLVAASLLAVRAWRRLRAGRIEPPVAALAVAAACNAALLPFVFLNLHSDVLMLVPFGLLALRPASVPSQLLLGAATGVFFVDGLFAVTYHSGLAHAVLPLALAVALAGAAATLVPAKRVAVVAALVVNAAVTIPAFSPAVHQWLSVAAALIVLERLSAPTAGARPA